MTQATFISQNSAKIAIFLAGIGSILLILFAAWQWQQDWQLTHEHLKSEPLFIKKDETAQLIAALPHYHLFGKAYEKVGEVPVTTLQMTVTGIVKTDAEKGQLLSKAYISVSGQPSKIYQIGDRLPSGVKIYNITPDEVILENEGELEKLPLPREKLHFKSRS